MRKFKYKIIVLMCICMIAFPVLGIPTPTTQKFLLNGIEVDSPYPFLREGNELLIPLKYFATQMGAMGVVWDPHTKVVSVTMEDFLIRHQYLSYLNGLQRYKNEEKHIPEALEKLELPSYPLHNNNLSIIHQNPIELRILSHGTSRSWAVYDYTFKYDKIYIGIEWLNTLFLAQVTETPESVCITYPTTEDLQQKLIELEKVARPTLPEEALSLWIKGQEYRSGGLQYMALSPRLQEVVRMGINKGDSWWVTGGSSPSFRNAKITNLLSTDIETKRFQITFDEVAQGQTLKQLQQIVTIKKYIIEDEVYWLLDEVKGNTDYYSVIPNKGNRKS